MVVLWGGWTGNWGRGVGGGGRNGWLGGVSSSLVGPENSIEVIVGEGRAFPARNTDTGVFWKMEFSGGR